MKRVFKLGILLGFIFSLCTAAQAATTACKINGVVTDSISGEAIPFVTASSCQNYRLVVSSVGYGTKYVDISLSENEKNKDLGTIKLTESSELSEVTVVAQKPLIKSDIDKITYDMEADPDAASNNALDMLRKVPMITVDAEENIRLNGQSNYKVLVQMPTPMEASGETSISLPKSGNSLSPADTPEAVIPTATEVTRKLLWRRLPTMNFIAPKYMVLPNIGEPDITCPSKPVMK